VDFGCVAANDITASGVFGQPGYYEVFNAWQQLPDMSGIRPWTDYVYLSWSCISGGSGNCNRGTCN
jgi:hypothetical protein